MQVFETPGSVSLQIRLPSGRVVVTTVDEPRTSVEIKATGRRGPDAVDEIEIRAEERHGGHTITIEQRDRIRWGPVSISWGGDVEVRVTCPPGADLDFSGASSDLRVEGDLGAVSVKTASGDVKLGDVANKLQLKTASGDIVTGTLSSGGSVVTVSGDVGIRDVDGDLTVRSVSGDIQIRVARAPLGLSTTSGDVAVESVESGEVRVQSVSGSARLGVGRGTKIWIDAVSVSGDLKSELGLADDVSDGDREQGGSVVPLHVKTVSGDVSIVRAAESFSL